MSIFRSVYFYVFRSFIDNTGHIVFNFNKILEKVSAVPTWNQTQVKVNFLPKCFAWPEIDPVSKEIQWIKSCHNLTTYLNKGFPEIYDNYLFKNNTIPSSWNYLAYSLTIIINNEKWTFDIQLGSKKT